MPSFTLGNLTQPHHDFDWTRFGLRRYNVADILLDIHAFGHFEIASC